MNLSLKEKAVSICSSLVEKGHIAYFSGGCVRDSLIGRTPDDYDIATSASPEEVMRIFHHTKPIGLSFGIILVICESDSFQVATFRSDGIYEDYRHPSEVKFSTPEEDAFRRDFKMNGLFQNPINGEIIDFVKGKEDIKNQIISCIGDPNKRFSEDPLRLLRAIRFMTKIEFSLEEKTEEAIKENAPLLAKISLERIRDEFSALLQNSNRKQGILSLVSLGLMPYIVPEFLDLIGCEQPFQWHPEGDVYRHTLMVLDALPQKASLSLILAAFLHDIGKPPTSFYDKEDERIRFNNHDNVGAEMSENILRRLRFSNKIILEVSEMVKNHMRFRHVQEMRESKLRRFMARSTFSQELELHRADCLSSHGKLDNYDFLHQKIEGESSIKESLALPQSLLSGKDLIALGFSPSPLFKEILLEVGNRQLEGELKTQEEAIAFISQKYTIKE